MTETSCLLLAIPVIYLRAIYQTAPTAQRTTSLAFPVDGVSTTGKAVSGADGPGHAGRWRTSRRRGMLSARPSDDIAQHPFVAALPKAFAVHARAADGFLSAGYSKVSSSAVAVMAQSVLGGKLARGDSVYLTMVSARAIPMRLCLNFNSA